MSRSQWASTEGCTSARAAVLGAVKRARLGEKARPDYKRLLGAAPSCPRLALVAAAGVLVLAVTPAAAMAASASSSHAQPPTTYHTNNSNATASTGHARHAVSRPRTRSVAGHHGSVAVLRAGSGDGSRDGSAAVRALQRRLAWVGYAPGPLDGRFGPLTEHAVMRLQAANGLAVDGIAGPLTQSALAAPVLHPNAGYGLPRGSGAVRALQDHLARLGFAPGPLDGRYGPLTEGAVIRFQAANGLRVDGIAGPRTLARVSLKGGPRRQLHRSPRPRRARPTVGHRRSHPRHSRPTVAHHRPTAAPAPATAHHAGHSVGSSSTPWLILVAGALLALLASQYARRRRSVSPSTEDLNDGTVAVSSMDLGAEELLGPERAFQRADHRGDPQRGVQPRRGARAAGRPRRGRGRLPTCRSAWPRRSRVQPRRAARRAGRARRCRARVPARRSPRRSPRGVQPRRGARAAGRPRRGRGRLPTRRSAWPWRSRVQPRRAARRAGRARRCRGAFQSRRSTAGSPRRFNLGVLLERHGDPGAAESAFRRAHERGDANGSFNLGGLLEEHGDVAGAKAAYRHADERGHAEVANMARAALLELRGRVTSASVGAEGGGDHGV